MTSAGSCGNLGSSSAASDFLTSASYGRMPPAFWIFCTYARLNVPRPLEQSSAARHRVRSGYNVIVFFPVRGVRVLVHFIAYFHIIEQLHKGPINKLFWWATVWIRAVREGATDGRRVADLKSIVECTGQRLRHAVA